MAPRVPGLTGCKSRRPPKMIGSHRVLEELQRLVKRSTAEATSVSLEATTRRVSRFAYDTIHQDLLQESATVSVKVIHQQRVGVAITDTFERASLQRTLEAARTIARHAPPTKDLPPLPGRYQIITTQDHDRATAEAPAGQFIATLQRLFRICQGVDTRLAGSFSTGEDERAVVNSNGVACYAASTVSGVKLVTMYRALSGFASRVSPRLAHLDPDACLEDALKQCLHRREPIRLPTGVHEVILDPEAVAELVLWLGAIAFGAKSVQERTSFMVGRMGEQVMDRRLTIVDDASHPDGLHRPFDAEGVRTQRVSLIERGNAAGLVYDTAYGALYHHPSTGHALPPDEVDGPLPLHLVVEPGTTPRAELIRACARGIFIPRFHYVSGLLNPREALMTGLTREGACLIEDGKLTTPITTMRFTQSCLEAFRHVRGISRERRLIADPTQDAGCAIMPTLHLAKFRFTGRSEDS